MKFSKQKSYKKHSEYSFSKRIIVLLLLLVVAFLYHSCRKDIAPDKPGNNASMIAAAKNWYAEEYPHANRTSAFQKMKLNLDDDLINQLVPDWNSAIIYKRYNNDVLEVPIDSLIQINSELSKSSLNGSWNGRGNSKSTYIFQKYGDSYTAYIMTLVADDSYINGDIPKLAKNTYNKRDPNYSGLVLYFTPNGKYVGGWRYINGKLVQPRDLSRLSKDAQSQKKSTGQSTIMSNAPLTCMDWWWITEVDGVITSKTYLFTECFGGEDLGGGGGSPTPPEQCVNSRKANTDNATTMGNTPWEPGPGEGGDDGGFPPLPSGPGLACPIAVNDRDTINKVTDSCINRAIQLALNKNINSKIKSLMTNTFLANKVINLQFNSFPFSHNKNEAITTPGNPTYMYISFNSNRMPNFSDEYNVATVYHEVLHAYLNILWQPPQPGSNIIIPEQHYDLMTNYIDILKDDLMSLFPNLSEQDALNLSYGGLQETSYYLFRQTYDSTFNQNVINTNRAYQTKGVKGTYCK